MTTFNTMYRVKFLAICCVLCGLFKARGQEAQIVVSGNKVSSWKINQNIFGKFFEPNGRDAYPGMVSQHLANGSFEQWNEINNKHFRTEIIFPEVEKSATVAYPWEEKHEGKAWFEMVETGVHGRYFQKIINQSQGARVRLYQTTALPDERCENYIVRFLARADSAGTVLKVSLADSNLIDLSVSELTLKPGWHAYETLIKLQKPVEERYQNSPFGIYNLVFSTMERAILSLDHVRLSAADAVNGMYNPTTLRYLDTFNVPSLRWPGGNYASMYNWRHGIGPIDQRPVDNNNEWGGLEPNYFGTNEYLAFCKIAGMEPYINVPFNLDIASPEAVANWVEYVNGDTTTAMGKLRKTHGYPEPWNVTYWQVGNEHYGIYQSGYIFPKAYAENIVRYVKAMKAVDSSIKVIAAGADPGYADVEGARFNRILLKEAGDYIDGIDIHRYVNTRTIDKRKLDAMSPEFKAHLFITFPAQYEKLIDNLTTAAKRLGNGDIHITVGEWNLSRIRIPGYGDIKYETMPHAAFMAGMYNVFMRESQYVKAAYQRDNTLYFRPYPVDFRPPNPGAYVLQMYAEPFSKGADFHLVATKVNAPGFSFPKYGERFIAMDDVPFIDAASIVNDSRDKMFVFITNRNIEKTYPVEIVFKSVATAGKVSAMEIYSKNVFAEQNAWDEKVFEKTEVQYRLKDNKLTIAVKPASVIRLELKLKN